ncbi:MAG: YtxH domain-containing protein [Candidatus Pristimantibacillus sp.]
MSSRKQSKGFLLGALAGGVIGSVTALLLAPKPGKELRQDISAGAHKVQETTVKVAGQVGDTTGRIAKQIGNQAVQLADKAKLAVNSVKTRRADEILPTEQELLVTDEAAATTTTAATTMEAASELTEGVAADHAEAVLDDEEEARQQLELQTIG